MAKKNKPKPESDGGGEEEEPDFSDPEDFVDDITDEGTIYKDSFSLYLDITNMFLLT